MQRIRIAVLGVIFLGIISVNLANAAKFELPIKEHFFFSYPSLE